MSHYTISEPDWSRLDFEVRKVIARHEMLFSLDMIAREPLNKDFDPITRFGLVASKAGRMVAAIAQYKQVCFAGSGKASSASNVRPPVDEMASAYAYRVQKILNQI